VKSHYSDGVYIESYMPREGEKDLEDIVWVKHKSEGYHRVDLMKEEGSWKIYNITSHFGD